MLRIKNLKLHPSEGEEVLQKKLQKKLRKKEEIAYRKYKVSIDARKEVRRIFQVLVDQPMTRALERDPDIELFEAPQAIIPRKGRAGKHRPVVVGSGPAGLFAAYWLAEAGLSPIVLERGEAVEERSRTVETFWKEGRLNPDSNVQFGEGGAGTFSDGKLTSRSKDPRGRAVLEILHRHGGPEEILYSQKPHIGTDLLKEVILSMRRHMVKQGAEVHFSTSMTDLILEGNALRAVVAGRERFETDQVILALGHSARDSFELLFEKGVALQAKPFAVGFRIEHPQELIDRAQYKKFATLPGLGPAEYRLTHQDPSGRGVYTFCMCPGGRVIASSSEEGRLVINGMSYHARDLPNANAAILVTVGENDMKDALSGIAFQRRIEERAFALGGGHYHAPVQYASDFVGTGRALSVKPSYEPGYRWEDLRSIYPKPLTEALQRGILAMGQKIKGFEGGVLTGVETRSSSPLRILRNEKMESLSHRGLYPVGEGAGYAGGIVSAAIDGIKAAQILVEESLRAHPSPRL